MEDPSFILSEGARDDLRRSLNSEGLNASLKDDLKAFERDVNAARAANPKWLDNWLVGKYTIIPENNFWVDMWDMVVIFALCVTALLLPWEVALITVAPYNLFVLNRCIDSVFFVDMIANFNMAFAPTYEESQTGAYEKRPMYIVAHYMAFPFSKNFEAGWFWPDLITIFPWEIFPSMSGTRSLRLVRVLRLVRMFRLVRVIKLFRRWHTHVGFSFSVVKVMTTLLSTLLLVHWLACLWAHLGQNRSALVDSTEDVPTWLEVWGGDEFAVENLPDSKIYVNALYLCCVVLTSVGFGDITPVADVEYMAMIVTIFVTALTWSWVVANVVKVITDSDIFGNIFARILDDLNVLMRGRGVDYQLRLQVRRHLYAAQSAFRVRHESASISWLSSALQGELAIESGISTAIQTIWYLRNTPENVIIEISTYFQGDVFSPEEFIMDPNSVFVVSKGSCAKRGRLLQKDSIFGEDMILATEELKDTACPKTLSFVEVLRLTKEDLVKVCEKYPDFDMRLRRAQVRLAVWRAFIASSNKIQKVMKKKLEGSKATLRQSLKGLTREEVYAILASEDRAKATVGWAASMQPDSMYNQEKAECELQNSAQDLKKRLEERQQTSVVFFQRLDHIGQKIQDQQADLANSCDHLETRLHDCWKEMQKVQEVLYRSSKCHTARSNGKHK